MAQHSPRQEEFRGKIAQRYSGRNTLEGLNIGDNVRMQPLTPGEKEWRQGTVDRKINSHSYVVKTKDGRELRRNRQHLRKRPASTHSHVAEPSSSATPTITTQPNTNNTHEANATHSESPHQTDNTAKTPTPIPTHNTSNKSTVVPPLSSPNTTLTTRFDRTVKPVERFQCK